MVSDHVFFFRCSSGFPCVGVRLVYLSLRCTATFVIRFHWSLLLAFSLHFSSSSVFLRSLFTQSSHLSCGLPRFLQPSCFIVSDLFGNFSSFILTMCPAHFIRLLTILPTMQALVPTSSRKYYWSVNKHIRCLTIIASKFAIVSENETMTSSQCLCH